MTRVNTSSRPVELLGLAPALTSAGSASALLQRHEIDAAALQHRAVGQIEPVQLQRLDALGHRLLGPGRKLERTR